MKEKPLICSYYFPNWHWIHATKPFTEKDGRSGA